MQQQLLSLLVENRPGALMRVAGVLTARGYNIESLTVAKTLDPTLSSMTIVAEVDPAMSHLLVKQIQRLVDVVQVTDLTGSGAVNRELALIKVTLPPEMRPAVVKEAEIFRAKVVDSSPASYTLEVTGATEKLDALIALLHHYGEVEMIRSGAMAIARAAKARRHHKFFESSKTSSNQERQETVKTES